MKEYKVSIIVPIYKVEKYLEKCIDSILNQTYKNLEIILVDDGSPDKCPKICDDYAKKDERIKVIHKKNGGLSDARNFGINIATGDYISFIDSDDFISNDYVEYLLNLIVKYDADMSVILPLKFKEESKIKINQKNAKIKVYSAYKALEVMLYQKEFDNAAWGKLYSRKIIKGIEFPKGKLYEDIGTTYKYILKSNKVVYSNAIKYFYLQRNDSIMGSDFKSKELDYIYQAENLLQDILTLENTTLLKAAICRYVNANFSILLKMKKSHTNIKEEKIIRKNLKKYRFNVLADYKSRFKTKIAIILTYIGVL